MAKSKSSGNIILVCPFALVWVEDTICSVTFTFIVPQLPVPVVTELIAGKLTRKDASPPTNYNVEDEIVVPFPVESD